MFDIVLAPPLVDYLSVTWEQLHSDNETLLTGLEKSKIYKGGHEIRDGRDAAPHPPWRRPTS